jgi:hypothetical protein
MRDLLSRYKFGLSSLCAHSCSSGMIAFCALLFLPILLHAQFTLVRGSELPLDTNGVVFYLDTQNHAAWYHGMNGWVKLTEAPIIEMFRCHDQVYCTSLYGQGHCYNKEGLLDQKYLQCYCGDSISLKWYYRSLTVHNIHEEIIARFSIDGHEAFQSVIPDTVQGVAAFCISSLKQKYIYEEMAIHGWGMLGTNGQWLIEPKFDAPFHFKNGIAEVLYYGQKRKINEKGEFVE